MKKKLLALGLATALLIVTGCNKAPKLSNGQELVAKLNGREITAEEVYNDLKKQYGTGALVNLIDNYIAEKEVPTDEDAKEHAQSQLDSIKLGFQSEGSDFELALKSSGYKNEEELKDSLLLEYKKNKVVENYFKGIITEKEINKYYEDEVFGSMDVRHILITPEEFADEDKQNKANEEALNKAKDLIKKLNEGADFSKLAKEHSADGSKEDGGLIENVTKDKYVKEFWDAAYKLEDGKYTDTPVKTQFGYHIILKTKSKDKPSLKDSKDTILDKLVGIKLSSSDDASKLAWAEIRKKYKLEFFDKDLKNIYDLTINSLGKEK